MAQAVKQIPEGFHTITPDLVVKGAAEAIEFYKRAFGAEELGRAPGPDGKRLMHAHIRIGDSHIFMADEFPEMGSAMRAPETAGTTTVVLNLYVEDADAVFGRAVAAGAKVHMPLADMFWGDRYGQVADPFGHVWAIATHKEDLTPQEIEKRMKEAFAQSPAGAPS